MVLFVSGFVLSNFGRGLETPQVGTREHMIPRDSAVARILVSHVPKLGQAVTLMGGKDLKPNLAIVFVFDCSLQSLDCLG